MPQHVAASIRFHVDHIRPRQHGGGDEPENLATACPNCNWARSCNLSAVDPATDAVVPLFNPRQDAWHDHFAIEPDGRILGLTPTGRATARLLDMNGSTQLDLRRELIDQGAFGVD